MGHLANGKIASHNNALEPKTFFYHLKAHLNKPQCSFSSLQSPNFCKNEEAHCNSCTYEYVYFSHEKCDRFFNIASPFQNISQQVEA